MNIHCIVKDNQIWLINPSIVYDGGFDYDYNKFPWFNKENMKKYLGIKDLELALMKAIAGNTDKFIYLDPHTSNFIYKQILIMLDENLLKKNEFEYDDYESYDYYDGFYEYELT